MNEVNWEIVEFIGNSSTPNVILRKSDNKKFQLGDYVTNGTQMKGHIERFEYGFKNGDIYVYTDWSGVGMNFDSIDQAIKLPSAHQIGHKVNVLFDGNGRLSNCEIIKVHFSESKVMYDLEVPIEAINGKSRDATRIYNVDSVFISSAK